MIGDWSRSALFLAALVEPSVLVVYKYLGPLGVVLFVAAGAAASVALVRFAPWLGVRLSTRDADVVGVLAIGAVLLATLLIYPALDVHAAMRGSDRDDALVVAASALLHGRYPYDQPTYLGNPITPMPGALLLAVPFVLARNVALLNVFWCGVLYLALRWSSGDARPAAITLVAALLAPEVVHEIATGGDMFANGIYVGVFVLLVAILVARDDAHPITRTGAAVLLGVGLSSRPTYVLVLPALFQYLRPRAGTRTAAAWLAVSVLACAAVTLPFYLTSPERFAPLHMASKLANARPLIPRADVVIPALSVLLSLGALALRLDTLTRLFVACGVAVGFPTYVLVSAYLLGPAPRGAWQFFPAGLSATGLYLIAFACSWAGRRTS